MRDSKNVKPEKKKHDHTFTDYLKAGIFSLVMLAPIFSIAVRCGYVMFNKNAYESYYGETINQETNVNIDLNDLQNGFNYFITNNLITANNEGGVNDFYVSNLVINGVDRQQDVMRFYVNQTSFVLQIYSSDNSVSSVNFFLSQTQITASFVYLRRSNDNFSEYINTMLYVKEYNNYSYLDNAFSYSIYQLENDNIFNWTQNTAIYTPIQAMCTGLGITEEAISIMLTYWILMIAIYIIVDMIVWIFTKLTHILQ